VSEISLHNLEQIKMAEERKRSRYNGASSPMRPSSPAMPLRSSPNRGDVDLGSLPDISEADIQEREMLNALLDDDEESEVGEDLFGDQLDKYRSLTQ
jgi:hypothetical protein